MQMKSIDDIHEIQVNQIRISDLISRSFEQKEELEELAETIRIHGLLQPVVLAGNPSEPPYELVSGRRRFLACEKVLNMPTIRAVFAGALTNAEKRARFLIDNLQRSKLSFSDVSKSLTAIFEEVGCENGVKEITGLPIRRIRDHLLIQTRASEEMKKQIDMENVTPADVRRVLEAAPEDMTKAERILQLIAEIKPTHYQKRRIVVYGLSTPNADADEIFDQAMKPHIEKHLVITLNDKTWKALDAETKAREMDATELAELILSESLFS